MRHSSDGATHEDGFVELAELHGIAATDDVEHGVIMFQFFDRGVALLLTYDEVLTLGRVVAAAVARVRRRGYERACIADDVG